MVQLPVLCDLPAFERPAKATVVRSVHTDSQAVVSQSNGEIHRILAARRAALARDQNQQVLLARPGQRPYGIAVGYELLHAIGDEVFPGGADVDGTFGSIPIGRELEPESFGAIRRRVGA